MSKNYDDDNDDDDDDDDDNNWVFNIWLKEATVTRFEGVRPWSPRSLPSPSSTDLQKRCKINIRNKKQIIFAQEILSC